MADTTTFFAQISSFFSAVLAYILGALTLKHKHNSTTLCHDLEVGIPSVERRVSDHFNRILPVMPVSSVVPGSRSIDGFVDIGLGPDINCKETLADSIAIPNIAAKTNVDTDKRRHFQSTMKKHRSAPVLYPAIPAIPQINAVDNRSKHRAYQFGPYALYEDHRKSKSRRRQDSFGELLDLFPAPPTYIPPLPPVINGGVVPQTVDKTLLAPAENCPSPTMSEEGSSVTSNSESNSVSSTDASISISISISISNETANTSVHEILELPCTSAIFKVLSSGIDIKDKNISRLTLIHNPEILVSPATDNANLSVHSSHASRPQSFCVLPDLPPLGDELAPTHDIEDSSHCPLDEHTSVQTPVQDVPVAPTKWVSPYVAPLRIVKKNKVQLPAVPLEPTFARRPVSGNWEQAMEDVLQAFRDAESEDEDFRDLFSGDDSFVTQSSDAHVFRPRHGRGVLDNLDEYRRDDCERRLDGRFYSTDENSNSSMVIAPPDLVVLKVEVPASVSLSSDRRFSQRVKEVNKADVPQLPLCDCAGCADSSYSWTAMTDDDDDNHSQEDDQWRERLELNGYAC